MQTVMMTWNASWEQGRCTHKGKEQLADKTEEELHDEVLVIAEGL